MYTYNRVESLLLFFQYFLSSYIYRLQYSRSLVRKICTSFVPARLGTLDSLTAPHRGHRFESDAVRQHTLTRAVVQ